MTDNTALLLNSDQRVTCRGEKVNVTVTNPILPGFHPDPSAVKVGNDYYIATSTFEWWPGVEIYHSTDLVQWEWVCNPISRTSQADLAGNYNSGSIWAPHLSYARGRFWLAYTDVKSATKFKDTLNYVISAPSITGPWSEPTFVTASGFDPSLFHDDDGTSWFVNMLFDWRGEDRDRFVGTVIQQIDLNTMTLVGKRAHIFKGTSLGVCEGPQIIKKDGWYYLICAAGGTEYNHAATVSRSRSLYGPWEESPHTPLMSTRDDPAWPLQKTGHCSFINNGDDWYATFLCGRPLTPRGACVLGRETAITRIRWDAEGWPMLENGTTHPDLRTTIPVDVPTGGQPPKQRTDWSQYVAFSENTPLPSTFKTLRMPLRENVDYSLSARPGWLRLYGGQSLSSLHRQTLFARRWQSTRFDVETLLDFQPDNFQQSAGLVLFYDTQHWMYEFVTADDEQGAKRYVQVLVNDNDEFHFACDPMPLPEGSDVRLRARVRDEAIAFDVEVIADGDVPEDRWTTLVQDLDSTILSDEHISQWRGRTVFTGAMAGICAQDFDTHGSHADFESFNYHELH